MFGLKGNGVAAPTTLDGPDLNVGEQQRFQSHFHLELNQVQPMPQPAEPQQKNPVFQRPFTDGDFEFVSQNITRYSVKSQFAL